MAVRGVAPLSIFMGAQNPKPHPPPLYMKVFFTESLEISKKWRLREESNGNPVGNLQVMEGISTFLM